MKARIKPTYGVTNKQKKVVAEFLKEEQQKQNKGAVRRLFKLMCVSLNDDFGFGAERLGRLINKIQMLSEEHATDEVFWEHVDKRLGQMAVPFEHEDYNEMEGRK